MTIDVRRPPSGRRRGQLAASVLVCLLGLQFGSFTAAWADEAPPGSTATASPTTTSPPTPTSEPSDSGAALQIAALSSLLGAGPQGSPITVRPTLDPNTSPASVVFAGTGQPVGAVRSADGRTLTLAGQGVWTISSSTGAITFSPQSGFQDDPSRVLYTATNPDGTAATPAGVSLFYPDVRTVLASGPQGVAVTITPSLDAQTVIDSVTFPATGQPLGSTVSADGKTLTVVGQGVWTSASGVVFTPQPGYQGSPSPISYTATDAGGNLALPATITLSVPDVGTVLATGPQGLPVTITPQLNSQAAPTGVVFPTAGQPARSGVSADGKVLTVNGQGVWRADPASGAITFTPAVRFQGDPTPILYTAADAGGNLALPATITLSVPDVGDAAVSGAQGSTVTLATTLDSQVDPSTVTFPRTGQPEGATVSSDGLSLRLPGTGVWVIDPATQAITFTAEVSLRGDPAVVLYVASDAGGNLALPAMLTIRYSRQLGDFPRAGSEIPAPTGGGDDPAVGAPPASRPPIPRPIPSLPTTRPTDLPAVQPPSAQPPTTRQPTTQQPTGIGIDAGQPDVAVARWGLVGAGCALVVAALAGLVVMNHRRARQPR